MTEFDQALFEDKYVHYFNELQRAYKNAFEQMNERYDSQLIHAIDQQILNESEPIYEEGEFTITLPDNPYNRLQGVPVDKKRFEFVLEKYQIALIEALEDIFEFD